MDEYYANQAGSGLGGFAGVRYQMGDGFFGRMMSGTVLPIIKRVLPYLGRTALSTAKDIVSDVSQGEKFKESFRKRLKNSANKVGEDAMTKVKQLTGSGRRRKRRWVAKPKAKAKSKRKAKASRKKTKKKRRRSKKASDFL